MRKVTILITVIVLSVLALTIDYCNSILYKQPSPAQLSRPLFHLSEEEYLELPDDKITVTEGSLIVAREVFTDLDIPAYLKQIDSMVQTLRSKLAAIEKSDDPRPTLQVINDFIIDEEKLVYDDNAYFINEALDIKKGSCVGFTALYLILSEKLQLPVCAVNAPSHVFARYESEGTRINIETTVRGKFYSNEEMRERNDISIEAIKRGTYLASLSKKEFLSVLIGRRGSYFNLTGDTQRELRDYSRALSLLSTNISARYNKAQAFGKLKLYDKALREYSQALKLDPNDASIYISRAYLHEKMESYKKALQDFSQAIKIEPNDVETIWYRGFMYEKLELYDQALQDYSRALKDRNLIFKKDFFKTTLTCRAGIYMERGQIDKALDDYNLIIEHYPGDPWIYYRKGSALSDIHRYEEAVTYLSQAINLEPEFDEVYLAYYARARCYRALNKHDESDADYTKAEKLEFTYKHK